MNIIFATLIAIIIILLLIIYATWFDKIVRMRKEDFFEKAIDRLTSFFNSKIAVALDEHKAGPWYLVVYTKDSNYPIWISNNTIRSVHPAPELCKIIVKQFNGEDMVIENVVNYEMCSGNALCEYDM